MRTCFIKRNLCNKIYRQVINKKKICTKKSIYFFILILVTSSGTNVQDIERDWFLIQQMATKVLIEEQQIETDIISPMKKAQPNAKTITNKTPKLQNTKLAANFGTSLLLCNSPNTPKLGKNIY